jgi:hypothetical protein
MAFRLPHNLQDALRYALRSQNIGLGSRLGSNSFDHCGALTDALPILCHGFICDGYEPEQQQLLHQSVTDVRLPRYACALIKLILYAPVLGGKHPT